MGDSIDILRKRAEKLVGSPKSTDVHARSDETLHLIYELNVHQAELEMQNDELRKSQQALSASREQLSKLFELAPVTYLTVNSAGVVTEANLRSEELFQVERSQIVGRPLAVHFTSESADRLFLSLRKGREDNQAVTCELSLKKGLVARDVRLDVEKAKNDELKPDQLRVIITDITLQKRATRVQAEHLHAVQHEKIRTLGIIAGGVAHDFNNLLTPIMMRAELAAQDEFIQPSTKNDLKSIIEAAENAAAICKTLLESAGANQFAGEPIDMLNLVSDQVDFLKASMPANVELVFKVEEGASSNILGEANKIRRVLANLVANSVEAIGDAQGTIVVEISTKYFTKADLSLMTFAANCDSGRFACISICDNGCGMDQETVASVFDAFFSTKLSGRGLGMSSVIGIIRDHGASIDVSSSKHTGTTIVALFPTTDRDVASLGSHADYVSHGSGTVLVVDDNSQVRESYLHLLDFSGFSTLSASSGFEAVEIFNSSSNEIDVVLLDLVMPEMNGVETLIAIREIDPNIPVVIASGYAEGEMLEAIKSHVVQGFVAKPCSIRILSNAIKLAIESKLDQ